MQLEEILAEWDVDKEMDSTELGEEARRIPRLHAKYLRYLMTEKTVLRQLESAHRRLLIEKQEYYVDGAANIAEYEQKKIIWKTVPAKGKRYIRSTVEQFFAVDDDVDTSRLTKETSQIKIEALEIIMKSIFTRGYLVSNQIDWAKWKGGN